MFILAVVVEKLYRNCVPACRACNQSKGSDNWEDWMVARFGLHPERKQRILDTLANEF